jgi:hypothetical protein
MSLRNFVLHTKKAGELLAGFLKIWNLRSSSRPDILSSWTFWSLSRGVGDTLAFLQLFECDSVQSRQVEEDVVTVSSVDESEALVRQPLDRAFCHLVCFLKKNIVECADGRANLFWRPQHTTRE